MYIGYKPYDEQNKLENIEGIGAQYQRIVTLLSIAKRHNLKYIYIKTKIGHNKNNIIDWDDKWEHMFNIKKLCNNNEINDNLEIFEKKYNNSLNLSTILNDNDNDNDNDNENKNENNILNLYTTAFEIFDNNPEYYLSNIQNDLINVYDENNNERALIYDKNKINIAIHIRVHNDFDNIEHYEEFKNNTSMRYYMTVDNYINLIHYLKDKYSNSDIHIFSQEKYFDLSYKKLRDINDINFHFDDLDTFDTFHHLCKSDVLCMGTSSFSILAAFYNRNTIIYLPYYHPPSLTTWQILNFA